MGKRKEKGTLNNQTVITLARFSTLFIFFPTGTKEVQVLYVDAFPYLNSFLIPSNPGQCFSKLSGA